MFPYNKWRMVQFNIQFIEKTQKCFHHYFNSFYPVSYKNTPIKTLSHRTERICTSDTLKVELMNVKEFLGNNGYPKTRIHKYGVSEDEMPEETTVDTKLFFVTLEFKGYIAVTINKRLKTIMIRMYPRCKLIFLHKTICYLFKLKIVRYPLHVTTNCVYKVACIFQRSHISRTKRTAYVQF